MPPHECTCRECGLTFDAAQSFSSLSHARERTTAALHARTDFGACWVVTRSLDHEGYARLNFRGGAVLGHRFAWYLATGYWPKRTEPICHNCPGGDNRACWRNDEVGTYEIGGVAYQRRGHLWLGTTEANMLDRDLKGNKPMGDNTPPESRHRGDAHHMRRRPELVIRGEHVKNARLTDDQVRAIRAIPDGTMSHAAMAAHFGVSATLISYVRARKAWAHVM